MNSETVEPTLTSPHAQAEREDLTEKIADVESALSTAWAALEMLISRSRSAAPDAR